MTALTRHGACGKTWKQRGNRTGHCSQCHATFEGLAVFDAHQRVSADGQTVCLPPDRLRYRGVRLRLVDGTWRGPGMPAGVAFGGVE